MPKPIVMDEATAAVLQRATVDGNVVTLPSGQLDRALYVAVNRVLEALGGKWNRSRRAHVFAEPVRDRLAAALNAGSVERPSAMGYFPTPEVLAGRLVALARIERHHRVLEPSAGQGGIADVVRPLVAKDRLVLVELQLRNCEVLRRKGYDPIEGDFLTVELEPVDRVVMNPPFERRAEMDHLIRAFALLRPGGRLVAVMSPAVCHARDAKAARARDLVERYGSVERNPDRSFVSSGTAVRTVTVVLDAPPRATGAA